MRGDKISIEQSKQIMQKYLSNGYNVQPIVQRFKEKRCREIIIGCIRDNIKQCILQLQGQLFASKHINSLKIYDNINNTKIMDYLLSLKDIFNTNQQICCDFLTYYKYKAQFCIPTRFHTVEIPVDPITSKKKLAIYEAFIQYFQGRGLFEPVVCYQELDQELLDQSRITYLKYSYTYKQTIQIQQLYDLYNGQLQLISTHLLQQPPLPQPLTPSPTSKLPPKKYSKNQIKCFILNYILIGLMHIYRVSNNFDKYIGCSLQKFKNIHKRLIKSIEFEDRKLLIKIGILCTKYDDHEQQIEQIDNKDIIHICNKIGIRYRPIGYPKWIKDNSQTNLYKKQKLNIMQRIKQQMLNIIKTQHLYTSPSPSPSPSPSLLQNKRQKKIIKKQYKQQKQKIQILRRQNREHLQQQEEQGWQQQEQYQDGNRNGNKGGSRLWKLSKPYRMQGIVKKNQYNQDK